MANHTQPGSLERTIALSEIHYTLSSYAVRARETTTLEAKLENLTPSATLTTPDGMQMPFKQFFEMIAAMPKAYLRHDVSSVEISFGENGRAEAISQVMVRTEKSQMDHWGEWRNVLVRDEQTGRWLIAEQVNVVDGFDPKGFYATMFANNKDDLQ